MYDGFDRSSLQSGKRPLRAPQGAGPTSKATSLPQCQATTYYTWSQTPPERRNRKAPHREGHGSRFSTVLESPRSQQKVQPTNIRSEACTDPLSDSIVDQWTKEALLGRNTPLSGHFGEAAKSLKKYFSLEELQALAGRENTGERDRCRAAKPHLEAAEEKEEIGIGLGKASVNATNELMRADASNDQEAGTVRRISTLATVAPKMTARGQSEFDGNLQSSIGALRSRFLMSDQPRYGRYQCVPETYVNISNGFEQPSIIDGIQSVPRFELSSSTQVKPHCSQVAQSPGHHFPSQVKSEYIPANEAWNRYGTRDPAQQIKSGELCVPRGVLSDDEAYPGPTKSAKVQRYGVHSPVVNRSLDGERLRSGNEHAPELTDTLAPDWQAEQMNSIARLGTPSEEEMLLDWDAAASTIDELDLDEFAAIESRVEDVGPADSVGLWTGVRDRNEAKPSMAFSSGANAPSLVALQSMEPPSLSDDSMEGFWCPQRRY